VLPNKVIFIEPNYSIEQTLALLKKENLILSKLFSKTILRITGNDKKIQYGEYLFKEKVSLFQILNTLVKGNNYYRKVIIPECTTVDEVLAIISKNKFLSGDINKIPDEGTLFPDTYFFLRNDDKNSIIYRMQNKMDYVVKSIWRPGNRNLNSHEDLIILASIIEAEALRKNEKYIISSVFHNRINKGMKLQSDPTVLYSKNLNRKQKTRKIFKQDLINDNPWNTYTRKGLPISAVCNPGIEAIKAAMSPIETNFLYFVSNGRGGHRFSASYKQHLKNIKLWKQESKGHND
jgi:UPF0755 protein